MTRGVGPLDLPELLILSKLILLLVLVLLLVVVVVRLLLLLVSSTGIDKAPRPGPNLSLSPYWGAGPGRGPDVHCECRRVQERRARHREGVCFPTGPTQGGHAQ